MNPTSLFTSTLNLVRRDPASPVAAEGKNEALFSLPDLPQSSPVRPLEPSEHEDLRLSDAEEDESLEEERDAEPNPEFVMLQRDEPVPTTDEFSADTLAEDGLSVLADGRRTSRGQQTELPTEVEAKAGNTVETTTTSEQGQPQRASYRAAHQAAVQQATSEKATTNPSEGQTSGVTGAQSGPVGQAGANTTAAPSSFSQVSTLQNAQAAAAQATPLALQAIQQARSGESEGKDVPVDGIELGELSRPSALGSFDDLGLNITEKVLGVGQSQAQTSTHNQRADFSGEVADAVQKLLADAADDNAMLRFRTEGGQTFIAQARLDPTQGIELRLLSEDPAIRAMLEQRLGDLRSALHRVGFGDAQVQVDRDPTQHGGRDPHRTEPEDESAHLSPRARRQNHFVEESGHAAGRLHLIL